jgi:Flp pilus assembly protein TadD
MSDHYVRKARAAADRSPSAQLAVARTAAQFNPLSIDPLFLQASALESEGRLREAKAQLEAAARQEPENFVVYGLLGDFEVRRHHVAAARVYYWRALALNPRDVGLQALARTKGR